MAKSLYFICFVLLFGTSLGMMLEIPGSYTKNMYVPEKDTKKNCVIPEQMYFLNLIEQKGNNVTVQLYNTTNAKMPNNKYLGIYNITRPTDFSFSSSALLPFGNMKNAQGLYYYIFPMWSGYCLLQPADYDAILSGIPYLTGIYKISSINNSQHLSS
ncbi:MAG: hypothetical protein LBD81_02390, partial [Holosporaceae bacterium]|nr:hypothetical protein [Holosporaceae bacterium]